MDPDVTSFSSSEPGSDSVRDDEVVSTEVEVYAVQESYKILL